MSELDFIQAFIEMYKSQPCLWKITDTSYHDKNKRAAASEELRELAENYMEKDEATKEFVTKKITSIRSMYRKEVNKVGNFTIIS